MIQMSKRLRMIAERVPAGSRLADIGSDHALLPAFLAQAGRIVSAVAGELNPGPYEAARKQVREAELERIITVRKGNGLEVVRPGDADVVTIAGMGGSLIVEILSAGLAAGKLEGVCRLVLQPNVGEENVRRWLQATGWSLESEAILEEDGKIYEILTAVKDKPDPGLYAARKLEGFGELSEDDLYRFGPYLLEDRDPVFIEKWRRETNKLERVADSLGKSELEEARRKRLAVQEDIDRLKELITCWQKDRPSFN